LKLYHTGAFFSTLPKATNRLGKLGVFPGLSVLPQTLKNAHRDGRNCTRPAVTYAGTSPWSTSS